MSASPDCIAQQTGFELATLEADPHTIFAVSHELALTYFNPAWLAFAKRNGGEPAISQRFGVGTPFADAIHGQLRDFYVQAFQQALAAGRPWHHDYECSSADCFRLYHQTVYPFRDRSGLLVVNSLIREHAHDPASRPPHPPDAMRYRSLETGLITQCANCRRVQRPDDPEHWDWVPAWVKTMPPSLTTGVCPVCHDYYWKHPRIRR